MFIVVKVIVEEPEAISAKEGVYVVAILEGDENVPVPELSHCGIAENPVTLPTRVTKLLFAHTV